MGRVPRLHGVVLLVEIWGKMRREVHLFGWDRWAALNQIEHGGFGWSTVEHQFGPPCIYKGRLEG